jgi:hypothetical protein
MSNGVFNISNVIFGRYWNYYDPALDGLVAELNFVYANALVQWVAYMADGGFKAYSRLI